MLNERQMNDIDELELYKKYKESVPCQKYNYGGCWRLNRADNFHKLFDEFYDLD